MTEMELLIDFFVDAERQGPGSPSDTLRALQFIDLEQDKPLKVADIGCGTGGQTITLAQNIKAQITAVDLFPKFLVKLNLKAKETNLQNKIRTLKRSMDDLDFNKEEFDIIWSEGAIYIMGFAAGIKKWKYFLKTGGYLAISELTWLSNLRPKKIEEYWHNQYSEVDTAANKIKILEKNGFSLVGYFILPESSWIDNYYKPM